MTALRNKLLSYVLLLVWAVPAAFALALPSLDDGLSLLERASSSKNKTSTKKGLSRAAIIGIVVAVVVVVIIAVTLIICCVCLKKCRGGKKGKKDANAGAEPMRPYGQSTEYSNQAPQHSGVSQPYGPPQGHYAPPTGQYAPPQGAPPQSGYYA
ncbi:unnamed protein product [Clonostachys byssicola]|uniref:Uncharacterized protein n=1 Tax=Clonostachys byssicola TaxID=160290 RepID=A0A9N9Y2W6_9HYPO|nr:unnamed protein product [Clonostachys byssicola]